MTDKGSNILLAQYIFGAIQVLTVGLVCTIYSHSKRIPRQAMMMFLLSKRIHSIYSLRLFNDPVAMLFMFGSILALIKRKWETSSVLFSLALGVKMNILLFAPGFAFVFYRGAGIVRSIFNALLVVTIQLSLAYPFLSSFPAEYRSC